MRKNKIIAGVDEVGRGCLAGPVVSAAVILNKNIIICASIFPQIKVALLGRINVGIAKTKTNIRVK